MLKYCPRIIKLFRRIPKYYICQEKFELTKEDIEKLKQFYEKGQEFEKQMQQKQKLAEYEEVFKEREQKISFQLMQMSEIDEVFKLYSNELLKQLDEKNPEKPFSVNELSLFLYFTSCLRNEEYAEQMKNHTQRFQQITSKILLEIDKLDPEQFCAFLWALSTYQIEMGDLNLNESKQYLIKQQTQLNLQKIPTETLPSLAFSIKNILKDKNELILSISKLVQQNISIQQPNNLITLIQCLPENSFTNSKLIFESLLDSYQQELISTNQFLNVIIELLRITNYQTIEFTNEVLTQLIENIDSTVKNQVDVQMSRVIDLILGCLQLESEAAERTIKQLLRISHSKSEKMNITEYISLFLAVGKIKNKNYQNINLDKTLKILIELSNKSQIFTLKEFEQKELVQLVVASAALRIDNKEYMQNIISKIQPEALHKQDLIMLAQSFIIYVRQFEFECLKIHSVCASKKHQFNAMELAKLAATFNRIKILIPDSPFFQ